MNEASEPTAPDRIECPAARDASVKMFIFAAMMIGFAAYTIYDHYILGNYAKPDPYELNPYLKYLFNHYVPFVLIPPGLVALVYGIVLLRRKLVADAEGIGYAGKDRIAWSDVTKIDATVLARKRILYLYHGQDGKTTLDEYYLQNFRDLVAFLDRHVPAERIVRSTGD